jgi:hypothetical protein
MMLAKMVQRRSMYALREVSAVADECLQYVTWHIESHLPPQHKQTKRDRTPNQQSVVNTKAAMSSIYLSN